LDGPDNLRTDDNVSAMAKILVVDDEPAMVAVLTEVLRERGHEVLPAGDPDKALQLVREQSPDLVLTDIEMPQGNPSGLEVLRQTKAFNRSIPVVIITGQATKERAVVALRAGAQDFIEKPFRIDEVVKRVEGALFFQKAVHALEENVDLKRQLQDKYRFENMVGTSPPMEKVYGMISRVANTDSTILILGESGTGKELVARALHYSSRRAAMPFIAVNCAALPEHLLESELFGHRKGAFTGAAFDKVGLFQGADGGTIFLDEIGSMPLGLQSKLLRFLQDKELRRVGDTAMIKVDVRVLAATNEPLQEKLKNKSFREDLYYRISVIPIELPPLRERVDDIPLLVQYYLQIYAKQRGVDSLRIAPDVMEVLKRYRWPGNVRELQNALERACVLCDGGVVQVKDLPEAVLGLVAPPPPPAAPVIGSPEKSVAGGEVSPLKDYLHQTEISYIEEAIRAANGNKEAAAQKLGISMATLYRKMSPNTGPGTDAAAD
jgi:DNA-binding NtrC family response regulator